MKSPRRARFLSLLLLAAAGTASHVAGDPLTGDPIRGKAYFQQTCSSCHADHLGPDGKPIVSAGPSLVGVVGRRSGPDLNSVILDPATLDKYLADPDSFGSAVEMPISVENATDRADVIAYLATLKMPKPDTASAKSASSVSPSSAENQTPKP